MSKTFKTSKISLDFDDSSSEEEENSTSSEFEGEFISSESDSESEVPEQVENNVSEQKPGVIGYIRVSNKRKQIGKDHVSLEMQQKKIEEFAEKHDMKVKAFFMDKGKTAKTRRGREELAKAIEALEAGDYFVFYDFKRLARNTIDSALLLQEIEHDKGAKAVSIQESFVKSGTSHGKLMRDIFAALAEYDNAVKSQNAKDTIEWKKKKGEHVGRVPYGKIIDKDTKSLVDNPSEIKIIKIIIELRENFTYKGKKLKRFEGKKKITYAEIADFLNEKKLSGREYTTDTGEKKTRKFTSDMVKNIYNRNRKDENEFNLITDLTEDYLSKYSKSQLNKVISIIASCKQFTSDH